MIKSNYISPHKLLYLLYYTELSIEVRKFLKMPSKYDNEKTRDTCLNRLKALNYDENYVYSLINDKDFIDRLLLANKLSR